MNDILAVPHRRFLNIGIQSDTAARIPNIALYNFRWWTLD